MREGVDTPNNCSRAWADEFLQGTENPQDHFERMHTACKQCKYFDECYPPFEKWDERRKALYNALVHG